MPTYHETVDDLNKKYNKTYVLYDHAPVYIGNFANPAPNVYGAAVVSSDSTDPVGMIVDLTKLEPITFDASFVNYVDLQTTRTKNPTILFQRSARRQWKRGLCAENVRITNPISSLLKLFGSSMVLPDLSISMINHLIHPQFPSVQEALGLMQRFHNMAISPLFAITLSSISLDKYLLTSHFGFVGEINENGIWVRHAPVMQEIQDWLRRTGQTIPVELIDA